MPEHIKDAIISIPSAKSAELEAWLLDRGFLIGNSSESSDGSVIFYAVTEISEDQRQEIIEMGGAIVSQWKLGEAQETKSTS